MNPICKLARFTIALGCSALMCGCLISNRPLFPSGRMVAQTPLKAGWYFKSSLEFSKGDKGPSVDYKPVSLVRKGQTYETYIYEGKNVDKTFQLFDMTANSKQMVAQAKLGKDLWGYQRVDIVSEELFIATEHECNQSGGNMDRAYFQVARADGMRVEKTACYFDDAATLSAVAQVGVAWPNADRVVYVKIPDNKLVSLRRIKGGPTTIDRCADAYSIVSMDGSLGDTSAPQGERRHVFGMSKGLAVAAEAKGNQFGNWGYILTRDSEDRSRIYCKPERIIKLAAILPERNVYNSAVDRDKISQRCQYTPNDACGTLEDMIARVGGQILLQGTDVVDLPKGDQAIGPILTVMGTRGAGAITILKSEDDGMTRVLSQND